MAGAIFARGSCRALRWMALAALMAAIGAGEAAAQTTPGAPTNLRGATEAWGAVAVKLEWDAPRSGSGGTVTGYEYRSGVQAGAYEDWTATDVVFATGTGGTVTVSNLMAGVTYKFQVRSVGETGATPVNSVASSPFIATPVNLPAAPDENAVGFKSTPGDKMLKLEWEAPTPPRSLRRRKNHDLNIPPDGPERFRIRRRFPPFGLLVAPVENTVPPRGPRMVLRRRLLALPLPLSPTNTGAT